ncbi:unnamed protein product [Dicrocoelium dendriticum]|nr:unnamed protein product [Dicrocoelium dendriticum]
MYFSVSTLQRNTQIFTFPILESFGARDGPQSLICIRPTTSFRCSSTIQAYDAAIKSCDSVLFKHPQNFKALFRKGKALLEQGDVDEAIPILRKVHDMVPTSFLVESELRRAQAIQHKERERWSRAANRMFPRQTDSRNGSSSPTSRIISVFSANHLIRKSCKRYKCV